MEHDADLQELRALIIEGLESPFAEEDAYGFVRDLQNWAGVDD